MARLLKFFIFMGFVMTFCAVIGAGVLFVVTAGDPLGFARTTLLRLSLEARAEDLKRSVSTDATEQIFTVEPGDTPTVIANELLRNNLIIDAQLFVDYVQVEGLDRQLEAGTYFLNQTQTIPEIAVTLTDSSKASILFRLLEGYRIEQIAEAIDQNPRFSFSGADFLTVTGPGATIDTTTAQRLGIPLGASLEGFMFPETYILPPSITALGLRDRLLQQFTTAVGNQIPVDASSQGLTMREIVTLASIVEREAVWEDEHPLIASVYRNRLAIGMKLDADPTVQYAAAETRDGWWPNITVADYQNVVSAYNTYLNTGLPPGPIANPGLAAIRAATYPESSDYFYFRARCDGSNYHNFAVNFEEHLANACT